MLFLRKKKRIAAYLDGLSRRTAFSDLLREYLDGRLADRLNGIGVTSLEIHIDWLEHYRCMNIQGRHGKAYVDIQVEDTVFSIACDADEPDDPVEYPLESAKAFYRTVERDLK